MKSRYSAVFSFFMLLMAILFCSFCFYTPFVSQSKEFNVTVGDPVVPKALSGNHLIGKINIDRNNDSGIEKSVVAQPGKYNIIYSLAGFPVKKMTVNAVLPIQVIPGGHSIGIVMHSQGVMVVGMSNITDQTGKTINPAEEAGIKIGDIIISINGKEAVDEQSLRKEIIHGSLSKKEIILEIKRDGKVFKSTIKTVLCSETGRPRVGLFVRDTASGVGTLSFYHPNSQTYGALGHIIADVDTAKGINLSNGKVTEAAIKGIHKGTKGQPGEKIGMFADPGTIQGNIEKNTTYGIFGKLNTPLKNPYYEKPIPMALSYQIKKGPAEMMTVIDGTEIKKYSVEIQELFYPWNHKGKGMIIRITDPRLINKTGGIIQGMSGSPIIQDGMLVGVLTHVFINEPLRGYGIPAEWMLKETPALNKNLQNAS